MENVAILARVPSALRRRILMRILREEQPKHFAFVLDGHGPNFRHEIFPLYKANRDATPEDLVRQLDPIHRMVRALGLRLEGSQGCEADDCIASLAARFGNDVLCIIGDLLCPTGLPSRPVRPVFPFIIIDISFPDTFCSSFYCHFLSPPK